MQRQVCRTIVLDSNKRADCVEDGKTGAKRSTTSKDKTDASEAEPPAKRGRTSKAAPAVPVSENPPPRKRGAPPIGGETTKVREDDPAAAEQLVDELEDAAVKLSKEPSRGRKNDVKGRETGARVDESQTADPEAASGGRFWLMKAEQVDRKETLPNGSVFNTKFTIDDLRAKGGPEPWDGEDDAFPCVPDIRC